MFVSYSFSLQLRGKSDFLCLNKLIDGPANPKDIQNYLKTLKEELLQLWEGIEMYDASLGRNVIVKGMLINCIQDGRAVTKCTCQKEAGAAYGCWLCDILGLYTCGKYIYYNSRRFLAANHPYRTDGRWPAEDHACWNLNTNELLNQLVAAVEAGGSDDVTQGVMGRPVFCDLPYWSWVQCHMVEVMHLYSNIGKRVRLRRQLATSQLLNNFYYNSICRRPFGRVGAPHRC